MNFLNRRDKNNSGIQTSKPCRMPPAYIRSRIQITNAFFFGRRDMCFANTLIGLVEQCSGITKY